MCHLKITTIENSRLLHCQWLELEPFCGTSISKNISYNYMSTYIGNDLEDRLEALETENVSLRKYNEYHQVLHEIDHMSDLHVDSSLLTKVLSTIKDGLVKFCNTKTSCNGVNNMWILKNSTSLLSSLDQLDVRTATSV